MFDDGKPEACAAVAPRNLDVGLGERPEQPLDLGGLEPDAAVGDGEDQPHAAACRASRAHIEPHAAALGEFHRIVDEIFQRGPQPYRVADQELRHIGRDGHFGAEALGRRPRGERIAENFNQTPRPEEFLLEPQRAGVGLGGVDHQTRQRGEMLGAAFDAESPTPLAFAEIGAGQQFAERQDAGKRRANVVRVSRQRSFADANRRRAPPPPAPRRFGGRLFGPHSRRSSSRHGSPRRLALLVEHDLFGKPVSIFPDHAQPNMPRPRQERNAFSVQIFRGQARPCAGHPLRLRRRPAICANWSLASISTACGRRRRE